MGRKPPVCYRNTLLLASTMATRSRTRKASTAQSSVSPSTVQQAKPETRARKKIANADVEKENEATKTTKGVSKAKGRKIGKAHSKEVNCTCSRGDDGSPMVRCAVCLIWYVACQCLLLFFLLIANAISGIISPA